jgi:acyl-CoA thioester hydrolase
MRKDEFTFRHPLRVRWAEVDRQGVVFNPQYFAYFDLAVTEYWRALGVRYPEDLARHGTDTYAVAARADFHGSAVYDDVLDVCCRVGRIGRSSMQFLFGIYRAEEHLASGELVYVNATIELQQQQQRHPQQRKQAMPWPEALKETIVAFESVKPELAAPP